VPKIPYLREYTHKSRYRDKTVILYQILAAVYKCNTLYHRSTENRNHYQARNTRILYSTQISLPQFKTYTKMLLDAGLITRTEYPKSNNDVKEGELTPFYYSYEITEKGIKFMKLVVDMKNKYFANDSKHFIFPPDLDQI
jgi:predicted transcriptional regulator